MIGLLAEAQLWIPDLEDHHGFSNSKHSLPRGDDWLSARTLNASIAFDAAPGHDISMTAPVLFVRYSERPAVPAYSLDIYPMLQGLVLEPVERGVFRRIGTFKLLGKQV